MDGVSGRVRKLYWMGADEIVWRNGCGGNAAYSNAVYSKGVCDFVSSALYYTVHWEEG